MKETAQNKNKGIKMSKKKMRSEQDAISSREVIQELRAIRMVLEHIEANTRPQPKQQILNEQVLTKGRLEEIKETVSRFPGEYRGEFGDNSK